MSTKELQEKLNQSMKRWQKIEDASIVSTSKIMEKTENPLIRLVMEIIQNDSKMHHMVQQFIADSLEKSTTLTPDEVGSVWDGIEKHIEIEKSMVGLTKEMLEALRGKKMVVQEYLLDYLQKDEQKHDALLETLNTIKKGMYPYG